MALLTMMIITTIFHDDKVTIMTIIATVVTIGVIKPCCVHFNVRLFLHLSASLLNKDYVSLKYINICSQECPWQVAAWVGERYYYRNPFRLEEITQKATCECIFW